MTAASSRQVERHAAELIAALHATPRERFGYGRDTLIGPLHQPNPESDRWVPFFRDQRLLFMARQAHGEGALPSAMLGRIEKLASRLDDYLIEPAHPSLLHGDLWTGNLLVRQGRVAGLVDPAIYCGHPGLAFTTLFGTFGNNFSMSRCDRSSPASASCAQSSTISTPGWCMSGCSGRAISPAWTPRWRGSDCSAANPRQSGQISPSPAQIWQKRTGPDGAGPVFPAKRAELHFVGWLAPPSLFLSLRFPRQVPLNFVR